MAETLVPTAALRSAIAVLEYPSVIVAKLAAWVILPEREFRLNKASADGGRRYSNGSDTLELKDKVATLSDSAGVNYANCKASGG